MSRILLMAFLVLLAGSLRAQDAGNALHFDGTDDRVAAAMPPVFTNPGVGDMTAEVWVFRSSPGVFGRILFVQQDTANFATIAEATNGAIYFYLMSNGTTRSAATTATIPTGRWVHLAVRWRASPEDLSIYFDGTQQATIAGGSSSTGTNGLMMLGARPDGAQPLVAGRMDELRIWDTARSLCAIRRDRYLRLPGSTPNLVTYYDFNQGVADADNTGLSDLPDLSGGDQNGTLANFALTGGTSNWIASDLPAAPPFGAAAISIDRSSLATGEFGSNDGFNVVLGFAPTLDVVVNISNGDPSEGIVAPTTLTFTSLNWNVPQAVTVTGVDDGIADGDVNYTIDVSVDAGSDENFLCEPMQTIAVTNFGDAVFADGYE
jgi:Concanavalin A-like lectin/glucanases superfamily